MELFLFGFIPYVIIAFGVSRIAIYWVPSNNKRKRKIILWALFIGAFALEVVGTITFIYFHPLSP